MGWSVVAEVLLEHLPGRPATDLVHDWTVHAGHELRETQRLPSVLADHPYRALRPDPHRHRAVAEHAVTVEHERLLQAPVVTGGAADHRHRRTPHPVHPAEQGLLCTGEPVDEEHYGAVRAVLRSCGV